VTRIGAGASKDIFAVDLSGRDRPADAIVIRRDVLDGPVPPSVLAEAALLPQLEAAGVPVATILWAEADPSVLGAPFLVQPRLDGVPAATLAGDRLDHGDTDPRAALGELARVLAQLHAIDPAGFEGPPVPVSASFAMTERIERLYAYWTVRHVDWSPTLECAFDRLRNAMPDLGRRLSVVHGDASLRNLLVTDTGDVLALLDWENAHIGCSWEDLGYVRGDVEAVMPWVAFVDAYESSGGCLFDEDVSAYFLIWRLTQFVVWSGAAAYAVARRGAHDQRYTYAGTDRYRHYLERLRATLGAG
jgi:aminoglycoside phosphotransferase (APT) family kinase protein